MERKGMPVNKSRNPTSSWWGIVTAGALALILGLGMLGILWLLARPIALLILGISIAAAVAPLVDWLEKWLPRFLAIVLIYLGIVLIFVGILWITIPPLILQAQSAAALIPEFINWFEDLVERTPYLSLSTQDIIDNILNQIGNFGTQLVALPVGIASSIFEIVLVIFISIYWLIATPGMRSFFLSLYPSERRDETSSILSIMGKSMGGYIRGVVIDGFAVGVLTYIGLAIIGVNYPLVLALIAGVMEFIPFLGPVIAGGLIVLVALTESVTLAIIAVIFVIILQQIESNILIPIIMRSQTDVSPLMVILAIIAGGAIGGLLGVFVAIPLAAAIQVFVREVIAPAIRNQMDEIGNNNNVEQVSQVSNEGIQFE